MLKLDSFFLRAAALYLLAGSAGAQTPPTVVADTYAMSGNGSLTVPAASGVLSNDAGFNPATHRIEGADARSRFGGVVNLAADGGFTYAPPPGFRGVDDFGYMVRNAFGTNHTRVRIEVSGEVGN